MNEMKDLEFEFLSSTELSSLNSAQLRADHSFGFHCPKKGQQKRMTYPNSHLFTTVHSTRNAAIRI